MKQTDKEYPHLKEYAAELAELEKAPPATIELPALAAIALISHVQLATRHPSVAGKHGLTKIAIDAARQLQGLFNTESATYKVLELGWNPEEDLPLPQDDYPDYDPYYESYDAYVGEAIIDRFLDPEQETATYSEEVVDQYKDPE